MCEIYDNDTNAVKMAFGDDKNVYNDTFTMGVVLFIIISGHPPFEQLNLENDQRFAQFHAKKYDKFWEYHTKKCDQFKDIDCKYLLQQMLKCPCIDCDVDLYVDLYMDKIIKKKLNINTKNKKKINVLSLLRYLFISIYIYLYR